MSTAPDRNMQVTPHDLVNREPDTLEQVVEAIRKYQTLGRPVPPALLTLRDLLQTKDRR